MENQNKDRTNRGQGMKDEPIQQPSRKSDQSKESQRSNSEQVPNKSGQRNK